MSITGRWFKNLSLRGPKNGLLMLVIFLGFNLKPSICFRVTAPLPFSACERFIDAHPEHRWGVAVTRSQGCYCGCSCGCNPYHTIKHPPKLQLSPILIFLGLQIGKFRGGWVFFSSIEHGSTRQNLKGSSNLRFTNLAWLRLGTIRMYLKRTAMTAA